MAEIVDDLTGWITVDDWCERYDEPLNTVQKRVQDGTWERGLIYSTPDGGQSYIHEARATKWLEMRGKLVL
jgi:hypothetical protein